MKRIKTLLILSLLLGFPLLLLGQVNDFDWLRFEDFFVIQAEYNDPCIEKNVWFDFNPILSLTYPTDFVFLINHSLSDLNSFFHDGIPFCRPPPFNE